MNNCVIFGATSDIAIEYIKKNYKSMCLYLFVRNKDKLKDKLPSDIFNSSKLFIYEGDALVINDITNFFSSFDFKSIKIDILMNFISIMEVNRFDENIAATKNLLDTNIYIGTYILQYSNPFLNNEAKILYISSYTSYIAPVNGVLYAASKSYMNTLLKGMHHENQYYKKKISILNVIAGPIDTTFYKNELSDKVSKISVEEIIDILTDFLKGRSRFREIVLIPG